jgi:hypothetical protein
MFGNQIYEDNPTGRVAGKTHFHHPFKLNEINYYLKHNKNYFRNTDGIPYEKSRFFKQHHSSVTVDMNNLGNFNPTNKGITYFKEHDTNNHIHNTKSHLRLENVSNYDNSINEKIEAWRKPGKHYHNRPEHSQTLNIFRM